MELKKQKFLQLPGLGRPSRDHRVLIQLSYSKLVPRASGWVHTKPWKLQNISIYVVSLHIQGQSLQLSRAISISKRFWMQWKIMIGMESMLRRFWKIGSKSQDRELTQVIILLSHQSEQPVLASSMTVSSRSTSTLWATSLLVFRRMHNTTPSKPFYWSVKKSSSSKVKF